MGKAQARALRGKYIEVYWDGEAAWYEAEVLAYDESTRRHRVRYTADEYECEELLSGPGQPDLPTSIWRACIKTTQRGAAAKAASNAAAKAAAGLVDTSEATGGEVAVGTAVVGDLDVLETQQRAVV